MEKKLFTTEDLEYILSMCKRIILEEVKNRKIKSN